MSTAGTGSIDKGGGQQGRGGTLADTSADDAVPKPVTEGRIERDETTRINPGLQPTIEAIELADEASTTTQYRLVAVNENTLTVEEFDGNTAGAVVQIGRPYLQRKTPFDGVEITVLYNGELVVGTYTYETNVRRVLELSNGRKVTEEVFPGYRVGDLIYGVATTNGTGLEAIDIIDNNNDARFFRPIVQNHRQFIVKTEMPDYWICQTIANGAIDTSSTINVAKPYNLRSTPFNFADLGGEFNGIKYTYSIDAELRYIRTAEDVSESQTQEEHLIPRMYFNQSRIYATLVEESGVTVDGDDLKLLDINADSRYWSRRA